MSEKALAAMNAGEVIPIRVTSDFEVIGDAGDA